MQISATYVSPCDFHKKDWWILSRPGPVWYYHSPRSSSCPVSSRVWLDTVDVPLRPLVSWAHRHGLSTTPSCAGHQVERAAALRLFDQLQRDALFIARTGIVAINVETAEKRKLIDPHYVLPWTTYDDFFNELVSHQLEGYIALSGNAALLRQVHAQLQHYMMTHTQHVTIRYNGPMLEFWVKADSSAHQSWHWNRIWRLLDDSWTSKASTASISTQ